MSESKSTTKPKGRVVASRYMQTSKAVKSKNSKSQSNDSIKTLDDSLEFSKIEGTSNLTRSDSFTRFTSTPDVKTRRPPKNSTLKKSVPASPKKTVAKQIDFKVPKKPAPKCSIEKIKSKKSADAAAKMKLMALNLRMITADNTLKELPKKIEKERQEQISKAMKLMKQAERKRKIVEEKEAELLALEGGQKIHEMKNEELTFIEAIGKLDLDKAVENVSILTEKHQQLVKIDASSVSQDEIMAKIEATQKSLSKINIDAELPSKVSEDAEVINKTFKVNQKLTKRVFRLQKELDDIQTMNKALQHLDEVEEEMKVPLIERFAHLI